MHDSQLAIPLANITGQRITFLYECMDSAYDAVQIHDHSKKHGRVSIIDTNPRRNKDLKESIARERKASDRAGFIHPTDQRYGERTVVERVNGRLKDDFGARHLRVRGHKKVYAHLMFGIVALCVDRIIQLLIKPIFRTTPNQTTPLSDRLHIAGHTDMPEVWKFTPNYSA